jgi:H+/Cl- antiporter ClcA
LANRHTKHKGPDRKGIGLYTYEQVKNVTAFDYFGLIVIGAVVSALGSFLLHHLISLRGEQIRNYGSAEGAVWGWITGVIMVVIGLFTAHTGVIFYARRVAQLRFRVRRSRK